MGRAPCCDKASVKKGPWAPEEDAKLKEYIEKNGTGGNWIALPQKAGLKRCGKSCRLRWLNYLRPNIRHGEFSDDEDRIICTLFASIGSRWSIIANQLPGRTDNDIKNYWNTKLKKKLMGLMSPSSSSTLTRRVPLLHYHHQSSSLTFPTLSLIHQGQNSNFPSPYSTTTYDPPISSSPISFLNNYNSTNANAATTTTTLQSQELGYDFVGPTQNDDTALSFMFGSSGHNLHHQQQASSSTSNSDGCSNNSTTTFAYDHQNLGGGGGGLQQNYGGSYIKEGGVVDEGSCEKVGKGYYGDLDCSLEEIKQLISSTPNHCGSSNNFNFFVDEIKTEEKVLMYY